MERFALGWDTYIISDKLYAIMDLKEIYDSARVRYEVFSAQQDNGCVVNNPAMIVVQ